MNKRIWIISLLFLGFSCWSNAQEQRFEAYLVGGFNMTQLDGDELIGFRKIGLNTGARVNTILSERWRLSFELLFSQQGSSRGDLDEPGILENIKLNFVEVPVMINFRDWKFDVSAGFSYNRLVNFTVEDVGGDDLSDLQQFNEDIFAMVFGATFHFQDNLALNVRWSRYFNSLEANPQNNALIGRNIGIRLFYKL